jgi:hypothetical protein
MQLQPTALNAELEAGAVFDWRALVLEKKRSMIASM